MTTQWGAALERRRSGGDALERRSNTVRNDIPEKRIRCDLVLVNQSQWGALFLWLLTIISRDLIKINMPALVSNRLTMSLEERADYYLGIE